MPETNKKDMNQAMQFDAIDLCSIRAGGKYVMYHGILSGGAGILHGMLSG